MALETLVQPTQNLGQVAIAAIPCPTDTFLDISKFPGPGAGYANPELNVSCTNDALVVRTNSIPHYEFVPITPNPLRAQNHEFRLPRYPKLASQKIDIPLLGNVTVAVNGAVNYGPNEGPRPQAEAFGDPIYNAILAILDSCMGHTALAYHYYALKVNCLTDSPVANGKPSPILGYAFDGFPIYGPYGCVDGDCNQV